MHPTWDPFCFSLGGGGVRVFGFLFFLSSSQCIPQHFFHSTSLCPICFVQCPLRTYMGELIILRLTCFQTLFKFSTSILGSLQNCQMGQ